MSEDKDIQKRFEAFQKTVDFHLSCIKELYPEGNSTTLIVSALKDHDIKVIYSSIANNDVLKTLKAAVKQVKINKKGKTKGKR